MKPEPHILLKLFLNLSDFEPQCFYKPKSYKKIMYQKSKAQKS